MSLHIWKVNTDISAANSLELRVQQSCFMVTLVKDICQAQEKVGRSNKEEEEEEEKEAVCSRPPRKSAVVSPFLLILSLRLAALLHLEDEERQDRC